MEDVNKEDSPHDGTLSHTAAMEKFRTQLAQLVRWRNKLNALKGASERERVKSDPLLCDLPSEVTEEEINSQIALEYGQAMMVNVRRADDQVLSIVVTQNATVLDLKHAIKRQFTLQQTRQGGKTHLSWRYVWKRNWLYFDGQKLTDDRKKLKEYGIRNKDEVTFVKRLKER